jgi:biopolymer transport protein ExbD
MAGLSIPAPGSSGGSHRRGRVRRRKKGAFGLQLTSLMDVLIIIVIFLLKSYGLSQMQVPQQDKLELPKSKAGEAFGEGIVLMIAKDQVMIDNEPVLKFVETPDQTPFKLPEPDTMVTDAAGKQQKVEDERGILPIYDALKKKRDDFETLASRAEQPEEAKKKWAGDLLVQADKDVPYELIRKVMYTAGVAGYRQFRLTVEKQVE